MKRLFALVAGAMFLTSVAAGPAAAASAVQDTKPSQKEPSAPKAGRTLKATGVVTAVSGNSLTIKTDKGESTFTIDKETKVIGRGAGTKSREKKAAGEQTAITDFVGSGDRVEVQYHDVSGTKHASNVRVTRKAT